MLGRKLPKKKRVRTRATKRRRRKRKTSQSQRVSPCGFSTGLALATCIAVSADANRADAGVRNIWTPGLVVFHVLAGQPQVVYLTLLELSLLLCETEVLNVPPVMRRA